MADEIDLVSKLITEISNYNVSASSFEDIRTQCIAKLYPQASHSCVTALTVYHDPTEAQIEKIDKWLNHSNSQSTQQEIISEVIDMKMNLIKMREDVFTIVNEGTCLSYGKFRDGRNEIHRDEYIRSLNFFYVLTERVKERRGESDHRDFYETLCQSLIFEHPDYVCGDMESLYMLYNASKGYTVPDFSSYNKLKK